MRYGIIRRLRHGIRLNIHPTNVCNMNCDYCSWKLFGMGQLKPVTSRSLNDWIEFLDTFPLKYKEVIITGAEPSLYKDVIPLVQWLLDKGKLVSVFSNMMRDTFSELKRNNHLIVYGSFHGVKKEIFNQNWERLQCRKHYVHVGVTNKFCSLAEIDKTFAGNLYVGPDLLIFTSHRQYVEHYNKSKSS